MKATGIVRSIDDPGRIRKGTSESEFIEETAVCVCKRRCCLNAQIIDCIPG